MNNYFIVPGSGNSGPEHWQTYFEKSAGNFQRIGQKEWDAPAYANTRELRFFRPHRALPRMI
jgi:predicted alpha/beta hydrolase family esterase